MKSNTGKGHLKKFRESRIDKLPSDVLFEISKYCNPVEFSTLSSTCTGISSSDISKLVWALYCCQKWSYPINIESGEFQNILNQNTNFKQLYKYVWPMSTSLSSSNDQDIECSSLTATFIGRIGQGYRSIQSNKSFPIIHEDRTSNWLSDYFCHIIYKRSLTGFFIKENTSFSSPYFDTLNKNIILAPRDVSYYEVTIIKNNKIQRTNSTFSYLADDFNAKECVAVGLAASGFFLQKRLPGWDDDSFGYHSDDGGIFHGQGQSLATYGPEYGVGDTVGCGINYISRSIFFTLNGRHLGNAFINISEGSGLHPTVGVDANVTLMFNFGQKPFLFHLSNYAKLC